MSNLPAGDMKYDIVGLGNPLLDISANVTPDFLEKYGLKLDNAILAEQKHLPIYKEIQNFENVEYIAGGATLNTIRVCQWVLQKPRVTAYIGCIGKDKFGETLEKCVEIDGVSPYFKIDEKENTGTCAVLINKTERSLCANLGAANKYDISHLNENKSVYENAKIFYIAGFFLTVSPETIMQVGKHAAETNKIFCLNLSAPFIVQFFGEPLSKALEYVDFLFANESEAEAYGNANGLKGKSVEEIAKYVSSLPKVNKNRKRTVIFTQGSKPTIIVCDGKTIIIDVEPIEKSKIVDSNGAGDAFVGGFLSRLYKDAEISECVKVGHSAARFIIQRSGTSFEGKPNF